MTASIAVLGLYFYLSEKHLVSLSVCLSVCSCLYLSFETIIGLCQANLRPEACSVQQLLKCLHFYLRER